MAKIKNIVIAVASVAALGAASLPAAQASDRGGNVAAGIVLGVVVGGLLANAVVHAHPQPRPMIVAPQPRVVYEPVVVYRQRPVVVPAPVYGYQHGHRYEQYRYEQHRHEQHRGHVGHDWDRRY
jgi:hypothetical protein